MRYTFYERNDETTVEAGQAVIMDAVGSVVWKPDSIKAIQMLKGLGNWRFGGQFDANNLDHWKALPELIGTGSRFWVEVDSGISFTLKSAPEQTKGTSIKLSTN